MLYLGKLRKDIINALDGVILPALEAAEVPQVYADFPLLCPRSIPTWKISSRKLSEKKMTFQKWGCHVWQDENLIRKHHPYLMFAFEGTAHKRLALSQERYAQSKNKSNAPGIYGVELRAPSAIYFPMQVPHNNGGQVFWEGKNACAASYSLLAIKVLPSMLLIHITKAVNGQHVGAQPLQVDDEDAISLARLYAEELAEARQDGQRLAQMYLTVFMLRLRKKIATATSANTYWPEIPERNAASSISDENTMIFEKAIEYIQLRLHEKLSLNRIAYYLDVSPQHLNRIFMEVISLTVMKFVTTQRIRAAHAIIRNRPEWPLQEISSLVGFDNYMSFYKAFQRETGCSPNAYRKREFIITPEELG